MNLVRTGVVGIGVMGSQHAKNLADNVEGSQLTAVCDARAERLDWAKETFGDKVKLFSDYDEMISSGAIDAVMVASAHYDHPRQAIAAFKQGLHVLIEKPAGVDTCSVREMNEAALASGKVFGIMYNQRTNGYYAKLRDLVQSGETGKITRVVWIVTNWFRTQAYYNSGGWRASWAGEGGGALINQCPHNIDLLQWVCGMPKRVRGFCSFGKYHDIEVEDDVTAYMEYENGATGVFITSTGDAPGTNRLEITCERGKLVLEDNNKLTWQRTRTPVSEFTRTAPDMFAKIETWDVTVPPLPDGGKHAGIMRNWIEAIRDGKELIAPGVEGINGLSISNAIHLSAWTNDWAEIPVDEERFNNLLQEKIKTSRHKR